MFYFQSNLTVLKSRLFLTKLKTYKLPHNLLGDRCRNAVYPPSHTVQRVRFSASGFSVVLAFAPDYLNAHWWRRFFSAGLGFGIAVYIQWTESNLNYWPNQALFTPHFRLLWNFWFDFIVFILGTWAYPGGAERQRKPSQSSCHGYKSLIFQLRLALQKPKIPPFLKFIK